MVHFKFIDLFAGIGGLRSGFEPLGGQCVFTSERDKYAVKTYQANYDCNHEIAGDITKIDATEIPKHDLLLAGFPCQPFSIAGISKKKSLNRPHGFRCEAQGTLFFEVARIIEHHQPKAFLLENVKNLLSHDNGNTFRVIHKTLTEELGYTVHFKIMDARYWVPQHRERLFMVGFKKNNLFSFDHVNIPPESPRLRTILHSENETFLEKYTLSDKLWNYLKEYAKKHKEKGNGFGYGLVGPDDVARTLSARYYKDGSEILIKQSGKNPRRLTPVECARLMGFDSVFAEDPPAKPGDRRFKIPVSDTQAYKQFGNSVVVPVVRAIAEQMVSYFVMKKPL